MFQRAFKGTIYEITDHPDHFKHLYENVILSPKTLAQIYCPDEITMEAVRKRGWGISPDFSITNTRTGKILFGEITFFDGSGYMTFNPDKFDFIMGEKFILPERNFYQ